MLPGIFFTTWRLFEIVTLIPILGMLSWFVHGYTVSNQLTPTTILVLFIVSVLAAFWAIATLIAYGATKYNAHFCAFVDLLFVGALIAGVYYLRGIAHENCSNWSKTGNDQFALGLGIFGDVTVSGVNTYSLNLNKNCAMLKASFALGIMNIIFFFVTFLLLLWVHREHGSMVYSSSRSRTTSRRRSHSPRHHGSSPRRSHHSQTYSSRRTYV
ncbi:hypothetical protein BT63DRAFT_448879 [Microthyrium microscopicum]|uniref:MARVEL domain-containing protein n=1 Tax=Microthyrium microscopicum TaxID=703497 RepID=A0A6A6TW54_9PEZI|nr:hypothetical protein BT63DRAFT_448879 [Microthyrium microscopicum]